MLFTMLFCSTETAAQSNEINLGEQNLVMTNDTWYVKDDQSGVHYPADTSVITVKLKSSQKLQQARMFFLSNSMKEKNYIEKHSIIDIEIGQKKHLIDAFKKLKASGLFEYVELNSFGRSLSEYHSSSVSIYPPNDPGFGFQYFWFNGIHMNNLIQATGTIDCSQVIVAVIDAGVDSYHPDLNVDTSLSFDFFYIEPDTNVFDPSRDFHGTAVSGIIGAGYNNGKYGVGVAGGSSSSGQVRIMGLRVGADTIYNWGFSTIDIRDAIFYAADNGANVINMSFFCDDTWSIRNALEYAYNDKNCLLVASAGNNEDKFGHSIISPAKNMWVIAVGGINEDGSFINLYRYGPEMELVAYAEGIYTTLPTAYDSAGFGLPGTNGKGTSFSAPMVSGVAALMYAYRPGIQQRDIRWALRNYAIDLGTPGRDYFYGFGRLSAVDVFNLSSGVYIYRIKAGSFSRTRKMILMK